MRRNEHGDASSLETGREGPGNIIRRIRKETVDGLLRCLTSAVPPFMDACHFGASRGRTRWSMDGHRQLCHNQRQQPRLGWGGRQFNSGQTGGYLVSHLGHDYVDRSDCDTIAEPSLPQAEGHLQSPRDHIMPVETPGYDYKYSALSPRKAICRFPGQGGHYRFDIGLLLEQVGSKEAQVSLKWWQRFAADFLAREGAVRGAHP
jgi:hypothetical protein